MLVDSGRLNLPFAFGVNIKPQLQRPPGRQCSARPRA